MMKNTNLPIAYGALIAVLLAAWAFSYWRFFFANPKLVTAGDMPQTLSAAEASMSENTETGAKTPTQEDSVKNPVSAGETSKSPAVHPNTHVAHQNKEFGVWVWESPVQMSSKYAANVLRAASQNGMNAVYITIDNYLTIASLPPGAEKETSKQAYFDALSAFIVQANKLGIQVDVEGGAKDWALEENRWKGYALIDFVKEYNRKHPGAKIRNLQYDVEPYLLGSYEENKADILFGFIEFIDESSMRMKDVDAGFSAVIPHFYDSFQKWTPQITYNGNRKYTFSHLLAVLEKKPGSDLILMSYRNFFFGKNGTKELSEAEIKEAGSGGFKTRIIVAQETGDVSPSYVTFYGSSRGELFQALSDISGEFEIHRSFGGVAVHYIDPFLMLR